MATKEEIERDYEALREEHEKLKLRYKEATTKLDLARELLRNTVSHLSIIPPIDYRGSEKPAKDFPEPQNEIQ